MRFDLRPLRLTTGWSEPNAVVSRTLSVHRKTVKQLPRSASKNFNIAYCYLVETFCFGFYYLEI